ncbi:PREDICTED: protein FAM49B-like [Priapulus caudatus]|uniref:Protein FAM49B-like n=1 Tax=Priapulus caudatus TaxID=37621 RepID=A0ABM1EDA2_PRICU|nr:PREDICTED: protein FAM49B-like [Priapulus caudatus]XP_014670174.1 PREDICTED: protein FAM49B-like [Priapulus caudatus]XP_014670175.1 PREDICTED: protein FAM49B-like [Priapulus caudatus]
MGNLLRLLTREELPKPDIFVDFENAAPTEIERETFYVVDAVLRHADTVLLDLQQYKGAINEIREAIAKPTDEGHQDRAWQKVLPLVSRLKNYYEFSLKLEVVVPRLLWDLCSGSLTPHEHLEQQQALAKQFAEIIHFTLKFDDLKMRNPAVQNDFSYYRRTVSRSRMTNIDATDDEEYEVNNELANKMSLFYAQATPMLRTLSDIMTKFVSENKDLPIENTTDCLSTMAAICRRMIENPEFCARFKNEDTVSFCLRVMVGVIILYDHVHPVGAFSKNSCIDVRQIAYH